MTENIVTQICVQEVPSWKAHRPDRYKRLAEYHAAVVFPYDAIAQECFAIYSVKLSN